MYTQELYRQLSTLLAQLIQEYEQLYQLALEKRKHLLANGTEELLQVVRAEEAQLEHLLQLENERESWLEQYRVHQVAEEPITMQDVIDACPHRRWQEKLQVQRQELQHVTEQLAQLNQQNQELLQQSLQYVERSLAEITASPEEDLFYGPQAERKQRHLFDSKA